MADKILPIGTVIDNRYRLLGLIGNGGMGTVYLATDSEREDEQCALKMLRDPAPDMIRRFKNEIAVLYDINHPGVVKPLSFFRTPEYVGFTMEYCRAGDLRSVLIREGSISWRETAVLIEQTAHALAAVHEMGVIHRDVKPENILLPARNLVKVTDFGTALSSHGPRITNRGDIIGTIAYISPEYIEHGYLDTRSDIYSLGVMAFEMVTGENPFAGSSVTAVLNRKLLFSNPKVMDSVPDCPLPFAKIIQKAIRRNPEERFQTAEELALCIEELLYEDEVRSHSGARLSTV